MSRLWRQSYEPAQQRQSVPGLKKVGNCWILAACQDKWVKNNITAGTHFWTVYCFVSTFTTPIPHRDNWINRGIYVSNSLSGKPLRINSTQTLVCVCTWQRQLEERSTDCLHYTVCVGPKNRDKGFSQFTDENFIHKINDVRNYVWRIGGTKMFTQNKTDWTIIDLHYHVCVFKMSHGDPIKEEQNSFYNKTFFKEERARKLSILMAIALRVWETFSRYIYSKYAIRQCMQVCCICFSWGAGGGMGS